MVMRAGNAEQMADVKGLDERADKYLCCSNGQYLGI